MRVLKTASRAWTFVGISTLAAGLWGCAERAAPLSKSATGPAHAEAGGESLGDEVAAAHVRPTTESAPASRAPVAGGITGYGGMMRPPAASPAGMPGMMGGMGSSASMAPTRGMTRQ